MVRYGMICHGIVWYVMVWILTVPAHSCCHALLEAAVLAPVAIDPENGALLVLGAWSVVDPLLYTPPEETLAPLTGVDTIVETRGLVTTHAA